MKRLVLPTLAVLTLAACGHMQLPHHTSNPYQKRLFYQRYLNPNVPLDAQIIKTLDALRANPGSASLHNDLGQYLLAKGFPKDAELEFKRAVDADSHFYPGWYNLGLVRAANGDNTGAHFALGRAVHYRPGYSQALFQLGLLEEKRHNTGDAIEYYAKAFSINPTLLDVKTNPRILDSNLVDKALIRLYPTQHTRQSMQLQPAPSGYVQPGAEAPSPQPPAKDIVTPTAPVTDPAKQTAPKKP